MTKYYVTVDNTGTFWYKDAKCFVLHREDGPAIEWLDGSKAWYIDGNLHRINGPAIEYADGSKAWWVNGERHREDGPAVEGAVDGGKVWYLNGKKFTEKQFNAKMNLASCNGKIVEIEGKKYKLTAV